LTSVRIHPWFTREAYAGSPAIRSAASRNQGQRAAHHSFPFAAHTKIRG